MQLLLEQAKAKKDQISDLEQKKNSTKIDLQYLNKLKQQVKSLQGGTIFVDRDGTRVLCVCFKIMIKPQMLQAKLKLKLKGDYEHISQMICYIYRMYLVFLIKVCVSG